MAARHVLKIPRSDEKGSFIIVQVSPDGPVSRPLNLKLVATEGSSPYVLTCKLLVWPSPHSALFLSLSPMVI